MDGVGASLKIVALPPQDVADVPRMLRHLAEQIERGDFDDAHNLAWVIDCGNGRVEVGLCGRAAEVGVTVHYLLAVGQRRIERAR